MGEENADNTGERYRIELACKGVPPDAGAQAAIDIKDEFAHRPWHDNIQCEWTGTGLILTAENDYDSDGTALMDEFSDAISACIAKGFDGDIRVLSVKELWHARMINPNPQWLPSTAKSGCHGLLMRTYC